MGFLDALTKLTTCLYASDDNAALEINKLINQ